MFYKKFLKALHILLILLSVITMSLVSCQKKATQQKNAEESELGKESKYGSSEKPELKTRKAEVVFEVEIEEFKDTDKIRLWLPYPVSNENQTIYDVKTEGNYDYSGVYVEGKYGNSALYAEWEKPSQKPHLKFSFKVERSEIWRKNFKNILDGSFPKETEIFLASSKNVPCTGLVKQLAEKITAGKETSLEKAEAVYDYLVENFRRDENIIGCGTGDVVSHIDSKAGKCADIHSVFVGLTRSAGIPAKEVFGIRIPPDPEGDMTKAYHCIGFFYLPDFGWVPVDASDVLKLILKENLTLDDEKVKEARNYFFGAQNPNYIEFGTGRDLVLNPRQDGSPLNYFMYPYAEVDSKPLDFLAQKELKYSVTYKEF